MIWLAVFLYCVALSIAAHELGHVIVGKRYGWEYRGVRKRFLLVGGGVQLGHRSSDVRDWNLGRVALAGPCATLLMTVLFIGLAQLPIEHNWIFGDLATFNFVLFVFNLLPLPVTDGGHILFAVTGWRPKWRHVGVAWVAAELLVTALVLLAAYAT